MPIRRVIPNLLTVVSLCSGMASVHFSLKSGAAGGPDEWHKALIAIWVAAVFDLLDGRAARMLKATSRFGAVLDSLADFLSFGVAPAILLHQWMLRDQGKLGMLAVMTFVLCAALRLARFTSMPKLPARSATAGKFFVGLPTPAAAGAAIIPVMLEESRYVALKAAAIKPETSEWLGVVVPAVVIAFTFVVAGLMISRVPMFSVKRVRVPRAWVLPLMVLMGLTVAFLFVDTWMALSVLAALYVCTLPASVASFRRMSRRGQAIGVVGATTGGLT